MGRLNLVGIKFGRLTVLELSGIDKRTGCRWLCECECNEKTQIVVLSGNLRTGNTKSCGCLKRENQTKHGLSRDKIYQAYLNMKQRCYNPNHPEYKNYGARGIMIADEWLGKNGFINFRDWSYENGYNERLSIDRKNVNKGYSPNNCRWATLEEQNFNKRKSILVEINGKQMNLKELSKETGIPYATLVCRVKRGWKAKELSKPPIPVGFHIRKRTNYRKKEITNQ